MRTSEKVMLGGLAALILGLSAILLALWLAGPQIAGLGSDQSGEVTNLPELRSQPEQLRDFDAIVIQQRWDIEIQQGPDWRVELIGIDEDDADRVRVGVRGRELVLIGTPDRGMFGLGRGQTHRARITLPALAKLNVTGSGDIKLSGFDGPALKLNVTGAAQVIGRQSRFDDLELIVSGAADIEFREVTVSNAQVLLSGAVNVELTMAGGELGGLLSGLGSLRYYGPISTNSVRLTGIGRIGRGD